MSDDGDRLLGELHGTLNQFMKRYDDDQKRQESYRVEDREDRRKFREEIRDKVDGLEKKIAPVVFHHQIIVRGGKWVVATVAGAVGLVKGWVFLKDQIGK
jgi:dsDNA-specific endonuclease/ATPase MutS2